ncbi:DUF5681 domain-containing protein [Erythrobacter alti]|uniref:DUF5681 domain-containing protein n=1 Tax=Erythrobacter alti TaxID=1896145 RepID=UPI0030F3863D
MPFIPASDWISAFPEEDEDLPRRLPSARKRTRPVPPIITPDPHPDVGYPEPAETAEAAEPDLIDAEEARRVGSACAEYEVGYGKPPVSTRFKPGQSGNPKGRPKGAKGLNTIVRETLGGKLAVRTAEGTKKISKIEAVLQKTLEKALKGDARAQFELMKLWKNAVPDVSDADEVAGNEEDLSSADLAILAAFEAQLAEQQGERS